MRFQKANPRLYPLLKNTIKHKETHLQEIKINKFPSPSLSFLFKAP